ncbi:Uncharacterised protein [Mycobacteroides abscessus subsp. abscessus]|uniref:hypothetical protein n=1 Tax=Mycobacteroides abscessus TaxID=36809 RepID=UPI00044B9609|nr:hypothetical protein [Mycobacteroides abscessus]QPO17449.1 hypothetical protein PHIGD24-3_79 [Mycobacterium phage phiGD24-3]QSM02222.1 hypothetical protein PROPHIGD24-3_41 [Mycobacterium phage prophiGD24-3]WJJ55749.1 hypothetical protein PROPHIT463_44 [Mycobacterium phage prophiT46-3]ETZ60890.1 hypothetical protein L836_2314 [Mycobacteroides abscessus MAB_110811_2726]EUA84260.1 hypothetical protein I541_1050 [Mycobacteroides abscessus]
MTKDLVGTVWDSKDGKRAIVIAGYDGSRFYRYTDLDGKGSRCIESSGLFRKYIRRDSEGL